MQKNGFTLIELAIVLVIVGLILGVGIISWISLMKARKYAYSRSILYQTKNCLLKRITYSNRYPTYTPNLDCTHPDPIKDVDSCLCGQHDAWGHPILYLEGRDSDGQPLSNSSGWVVENKPANQTDVVNAISKVVDPHGKTIFKVAFVLISKGENNQLDDPSYSNLFNGNSIVGVINNNPEPNFAHNTDDVVVIVSGYELKNMLKSLNY